MYKYPYGDSQQLNLDWILAKLKELEAAGLGLDLEEIANVFIALTYSSGTQYRRYDYCYYQGKLYRALNDNIGAFNASDWMEVRLGDDIPVLTRLINAIDAAAVVDVKFDTSGTNGKLQQKYNNNYHDVVEVDYTPVQNSKRPLSSDAGYNLNDAISVINDCLEGKKIALLGDSNANLWGQTNPFADVPIDSFYNYAVGGACWSTQTTNNMLAQYNTMVAAGITPDYVILWAGGNDISFYHPDYGLPELDTFSDAAGNTTFECMRHILYLLRNNYPSAKLLGITRNNKPNSNQTSQRQNYAYGMMEFIYEAWNIPIISLDSILNITANVPASNDPNFQNDGIHYNAAGFAKITSIIVATMRGAINTHKAREITNVYAPSNIDTAEDALSWCCDNLLKGNSSYLNTKIPQSGYQIWYTDSNNNWQTTQGFLFAAAVGMGHRNGNWWLRDIVARGGSNNHSLLIGVDSTTALDSLRNLPDGIFAFRLNQITGSTNGIPAAIASDLTACGGRFIGMHQSNYRWQGMLVVCFSSSTPMHRMYSVYLDTTALGETRFMPIDDPNTTYTGAFTD